MSADDNNEHQRRLQREAELVANRIEEVREKPIEGDFDLEHLKKVHAHLFQDLPEHRPGVIRSDTDDWTKTRELEGNTNRYLVYYASRDIGPRISTILDEFGGPDAIRGLSQDDAASRLADLYGDLDHAHGFYEGNSRTLREFTRELASEAGFELDWTGTNVDRDQRNKLYLARDLAVLERAFPDVTVDNATDRKKYEAAFVIGGLRRVVGQQNLEFFIGDRLSLDEEIEYELPKHTPDLDRGIDF